MNKDLREIFGKLEAQGWRIVQGSKHFQAIPPDRAKPIVTISSTPSGSRWKQSVLGDLRRSGADI